MKIKGNNLISWRENTLDLAREMSFNESILNYLENTPLSIIEGDGGANYYGWAVYSPIGIEVYETNPSKYFPQPLWEVWNQSGMDHELIGHLYNYCSKLPYDEPAARKTQIEMAIYRGKNSLIWKMAATAEPLIRNVQKLLNRKSNKPISY